MTTDTHPTTRQGFDHAVAYHASDAELLAVAVPFLLAGIAEGEPTMVTMTGARTELVRAALPDSPAITYVTADDLYAGPAGAIKAYRDLLGDLVAGGARTIRIIGEFPRRTFGPRWGRWARYESAINSLYDEFPLRGICAYDTRATPRHVLDDVAMTHSLVAGPAGWRPARDHYVEPATYLTRPQPVADHPVQTGPPVADLVDPTPATARRTAAAADRGGLPADKVEDFVLSVSEAVANAHRHGRPPVRLRVWAEPGSLVATVHDNGPGPADPFAGLVPAPGRPSGGLGLWIAHQMCDNIAFARDDDGFTIRLTAGDPRSAPVD